MKTKKDFFDFLTKIRREAIAETVETILDFIWKNRTATKELNIMMYVAMLRKKGIKPLTSKEQEEHLNDLFNYHIYCPPNCPRFKDILGDITRNI